MPQAAHGTTQSEIDRLNALVRADPDINTILTAERARLAATRDSSGKDKEYQDGIARLVTEIAKKKGLLPNDKYFVNPNDGNLEPHRGWSGMGNWTRALVIAGVAGATIATAGAFGIGLGAGGGAAAGGASAAGGGAAAAGGVGTAGAVSAAGVAASSAGWLAPLLTYGVPAAAGIVGTVMQNRAAGKANEENQGYLDRALASEEEERKYQREQDADRLKYDRDRLSMLDSRYGEERDYERGRHGEERDYGRGQYSSYLGRLEPYRTSGMPSLGRMETQLSTGFQGNRSTGGNGGMVTLRAPDGQTQQVPVAQATHYERLGAVRV